MRKPTSLPKTAPSKTYTPEEVQYLNSLQVFEVDGDDLTSVQLPAGRHILVDFNTGLPWLTDTAGFDYPRYVMSVNGYDKDLSTDEVSNQVASVMPTWA